MNRQNDLKYYIIYKPYMMLSQFSPEAGHRTLGELFDFPKDVYPVGRLDSDSEGMLLLSNDKKVNGLLLHPSRKHKKIYWVQVDGVITEEAIDADILATSVIVLGQREGMQFISELNGVKVMIITSDGDYIKN